MKRVLIALFFLLAEFSSASIVVNGANVDGSYVAGSLLKGYVNLSLIDEPVDSLFTSNNGDFVSLIDVLKKENFQYTCKPRNCLNGYKSKKSAKSLTESVSYSSPKIIGFILKGENLNINSITFNVSSDFGSGTIVPLIMNFFNRINWSYREFSKTKFSTKNYGCFNALYSVPGPYLGKNEYCEEIAINTTNKMHAGVDIKGSGTEKIKMTLYDNNNAKIESCSYNPNKNSSCIFDDNNLYNAGKYSVCASSDKSTNYRILIENVPKNCGYFSLDNQKRIRDYSIFVRTALFSDASKGLNSFDFEDIASKADDYIDDNFGRNCSNGCALPIVVKGVNQNFKIKDLVVDYSASEGNLRERILHLFDTIYPRVSFSNETIDLTNLGFRVNESGLYTLKLGNVILFSVYINVIKPPKIISIYPTNPPVGVPIKFKAVVYAPGLTNLTYLWDFGDGKTIETKIPRAVHAYKSIGEFNITLSVRSEYGTTKSKIKVNATDSKDAVVFELQSKNKSLTNFLKKLGAVPPKARSLILDSSGAKFVSTELKNINNSLKNASQLDIINISQKLFSLNVPFNIFSKKRAERLVRSSDEFSLKGLSGVLGSYGDDEESYKSKILSWQNSNFNSRINSETFVVNYEDGSNKTVLKLYEFDILSYADIESFLIISASLNETTFEDDVEKIDAGQFTAVKIRPKDRKIIRLSVENKSNMSFFISPKLSEIILRISPCNYNLICEKDAGENSRNCRTDCKPILSSILMALVGLIIVLIVYTIVQEWYKRNYEKHLFRDRRNLFNLVSFIQNASSRGLSDKEIISILKKKNWTSERVKYAMKKARGQRTGMIEIIPVDKILSLFRKPNKNKIVTAPRQQDIRNINKSFYQGNLG